MRHAIRFLTVTIFINFAPSASALPKFEKQVIDDAIQIGYGLAIGDVDGDKKPDILLADKSQIAWYRNGDWKRFVMAENLNPRVGTRFLDNVCIAARDINGDGKVEVAVGGNWNPGETTDKAKSGSVHLLERPDDPTQRWTPKPLDHLPTVHRMHFADTGDGMRLFALPLHGVGNKGGKGETVKLLSYPAAGGEMKEIDTGLHATHNFELVPGKVEALVVGGAEGIVQFHGAAQKPSVTNPPSVGVGEVRVPPGGMFFKFVAIEPMHGNEVVTYNNRAGGDGVMRTVLDDTLNQGHALAVADLEPGHQPEIIAGWRTPNADGKVGIKYYHRTKEAWHPVVIDDNTMACEDLKVADLNADGRPDIIASGRKTKNVIIYWNRKPEGEAP